jgi:hypothetical protein
MKWRKTAVERLLWRGDDASAGGFYGFLSVCFIEFFICNICPMQQKYKGIGIGGIACGGDNA